MAQALQIVDTEELLGSLLRNAGEKEWEVLNKAIEIIDTAQKKELLSKIVNDTKKYIDFSQKGSRYFTSQNASEFDIEFIKIITIKLKYYLENDINRYRSPINEAELYDILSNLCFRQGLEDEV